MQLLFTHRMGIPKFPKESPITILSLAALTVFIVWCLWWIFAPGFVDKDMTRAAVGGEMFGSLAALFTGLGFAGLVLTVYLQSEQLAVSKAEVVQAKKESEELRKTGDQQRFENTFFQLLGLFTGVINSMAAERSTYGIAATVQGREALLDFSSSLLATLRGELTNILTVGASPKPNPTDRLAILEDRYMDWYTDRSIYVAHYFRVLYRLLKHIDLADSKDRKSYAKMVRALLSEQELMLIFYNSFGAYGKKMKKHIYAYALLKHMPNHFLAIPTDRDLYDDPAYYD